MSLHQTHEFHRIYHAHVKDAADFIKKRIPKPPSIALLTGTGLDGCVSTLSPNLKIDYAEIPHFPTPTVSSHQGKLLWGTLANTPLLALIGRFHLYEGYSPLQVTFPIRILKALGINTLILTNAAGGLNLTFSSGDIMIIDDHINLTGVNPLTGPNTAEWGPRFPDMTRTYAPDLIRIAEKAGQETQIQLQKGVYVGLAGPSLETPAETRFLRQTGADAVGFSTVAEAIAAVHAGMYILGFSVITNVNDPDHPSPTTVQSVLDVASSAVPKLSSLLTAAIKGILCNDLC